MNNDIESKRKNRHKQVGDAGKPGAVSVPGPSTSGSTRVGSGEQKGARVIDNSTATSADSLDKVSAASITRPADATQEYGINAGAVAIAGYQPRNGRKSDELVRGKLRRPGREESVDDAMASQPGAVAVNDGGRAPRNRKGARQPSSTQSSAAEDTTAVQPGAVAVNDGGRAPRSRKGARQSSLTESSTSASAEDTTAVQPGAVAVNDGGRAPRSRKGARQSSSTQSSAAEDTTEVQPGAVAVNDGGRAPRSRKGARQSASSSQASGVTSAADTTTSRPGAVSVNDGGVAPRNGKSARQSSTGADGGTAQRDRNSSGQSASLRASVAVAEAAISGVPSSLGESRFDKLQRKLAEEDLRTSGNSETMNERKPGDVGNNGFSDVTKNAPTAVKPGAVAVNDGGRAPRSRKGARQSSSTETSSSTSAEDTTTVQPGAVAVNDGGRAPRSRKGARRSGSSSQASGATSAADTTTSRPGAVSVNDGGAALRNEKFSRQSSTASAASSASNTSTAQPGAVAVNDDGAAPRDRKSGRQSGSASASASLRASVIAGAISEVPTASGGSRFDNIQRKLAEEELRTSGNSETVNERRPGPNIGDMGNNGFSDVTRSVPMAVNPGVLAVNDGGRTPRNRKSAGKSLTTESSPDAVSFQPGAVSVNDGGAALRNGKSARQSTTASAASSASDTSTAQLGAVAVNDNGTAPRDRKSGRQSGSASASASASLRASVIAGAISEVPTASGGSRFDNIQRKLAEDELRSSANSQTINERESGAALQHKGSDGVSDAIDPTIAKSTSTEAASTMKPPVVTPGAVSSSRRPRGKGTGASASSTATSSTTNAAAVEMAPPIRNSEDKMTDKKKGQYMVGGMMSSSKESKEQAKTNANSKGATSSTGIAKGKELDSKGVKHDEKQKLGLMDAVATTDFKYGEKHKRDAKYGEKHNQLGLMAAVHDDARMMSAENGSIEKDEKLKQGGGSDPNDDDKNNVEADGDKGGDPNSFAMPDMMTAAVVTAPVAPAAVTATAESGEDKNESDEANRLLTAHVVDEDALAQQFVVESEAEIRRQIVGECVEALVVADEEEEEKPLWRRCLPCICFILIAAIVGGAVGGSVGGDDDDDGGFDVLVPTSAPTDAPTLGDFDYLLSVLSDVSDPDDMTNNSTAQYETLTWLVFEDPAMWDFRRIPLDNLKDRYICALLYFATGGNNSWVDDLNFLSNSSVCEWSIPSDEVSADREPLMNGITCDAGGIVNSVRIVGNNLNGTIPVEISSFSGLERLTLSDNSLYGSIPNDLHKLARLHHFELDQNQLTGTIPIRVGSDLTNVEIMSLFDNQLTGIIPPGMTTVGPLEELNLYNNALTGPIPGFAAHMGVKHVRLQNNKISGTLPGSITSLLDLLELDVSYNNLSGVLPKKIGSLGAAEELYLNNNNFTGPLPTDEPGLQGADRLRFLHLNSNQFDGTIVEELSDISRLEELFLYDNRFTGALPSSFVDLSDLRDLRVDQTFVSGTIPTEYSRLNKLESFNISLTSITGSLDDPFCSVGNPTLEIIADCDEITCSCCVCFR